MAHFAQLSENNVVVRVIVVGNEDIIEPKAWWDPFGLITGKKESEQVGISFCQNHIKDPNSIWRQTSKNRKFRGNYAGRGKIYMEGVKTLGVASTDIFIDPPPYSSWTIGINTAEWYPPADAGSPPELTSFEKAYHMEYIWDESKYRLNPSSAWVLVNWKRAVEESQAIYQREQVIVKRERALTIK
tara:strand:+ start:138 stop:695 length:558 start_codon:yes stop_codon:yes gene_type:complete